MADQRRNRDESEKPDESVAAPPEDRMARPLTPGQRETHRRDVDKEHDAERERLREAQTQQFQSEAKQAEAEAQRVAAERKHAAAEQEVEAPRASQGPAEEPPPPVVEPQVADKPALAAMTMNELYDCLDEHGPHAGHQSMADIVERVRAAIRAQAPDYQELACRLVMAPGVQITLEAAKPVSQKA